MQNSQNLYFCSWRQNRWRSASNSTTTGRKLWLTTTKECGLNVVVDNEISWREAKQLFQKFLKYWSRYHHQSPFCRKPSKQLSFRALALLVLILVATRWVRTVSRRFTMVVCHIFAIFDDSFFVSLRVMELNKRWLLILEFILREGNTGPSPSPWICAHLLHPS